MTAPRLRGKNKAIIVALLVLLACALLVGGLFVGGLLTGTTVPIRPNVATTWRVSASYPGIPGINSIACPSTSTCYAVGRSRSTVSGDMIATSNGGATWTQRSVPARRYLGNIVCPSIATCYAIAYKSPFGGAVGIVATSNGGATWAQTGLPSGTVPTDISCPSTTVCYVVGHTETSPSPSTPSPPPSTPSPPPSSTVPSPPPPSEMIATSNGGATWVSHTVPSGVSVGAITCPSVSVCFATGWTGAVFAEIIATTNGGATWTMTRFLRINGFAALECPSTTVCFGLGHSYPASYGTTTHVVKTTNGGKTWTREQIPASVKSLSALACPSLDTCYAVGGNGMSGGGYIAATHDGGATWVRQQLSHLNEPNLSDIACPSTTTCYASSLNNAPAISGVTSQLIVTTDGGTTWVDRGMLSGVGSILLAGCPTVTTCYAFGPANSMPVVLVTHDRGATWERRVVQNVSGINSMSCPQVKTCYAVGGDSFFSSFSGGTWKSVSLLVATYNGGRTWKQLKLPSGNTPGKVICTSVTTCYVALDIGPFKQAQIVATTNGGATWRQYKPPGGNGYHESISCPAISQCYALVSGGSSAPRFFVTIDSGARWALRGEPSRSGILLSLACPGVSTCYAISPQQGASRVFVTTDAGRTWRAESVPANVGGLNAISCSTVSRCTAVGSKKPGPIRAKNSFLTINSIVLATTDGGRTWVEKTVPVATQGLTRITCPSQTTCFASGANASGGGLILIGESSR